jgi:3D (Asp-Asp-Asp) domain-containing protein
VKWPEVRKVIIATAFAIVLINSDSIRLPLRDTALRHAPVTVYGVPVLPAAIVRAVKPYVEKGAIELAPVGQAIKVSLTQYCLKGTTRRGRWVRPGIVAADPRIFPLARYVEIHMNGEYLGRFLVDDTGANVLGPTLDIWNPSCKEATRFGRQWGTAMLVAKEIGPTDSVLGQLPVTGSRSLPPLRSATGN